MTQAGLPLVFVHGWGFDGSVWDGLAQALDRPDARVLEAGYFGRAVADELPPSYVAIGHSLGALRCLQRLRGGHGRGCKGLILINGFPRFSAADDFPQGVPLRLLDRMLARLASAPTSVVEDFRARCGDAQGLGALIPRVEPLAAGLRDLRDGDARAELARLDMPLLVLAGGADPIVPPALTRAAFAGRESSLRWAEDGGHLLPLTHTDWCAARIRDFLASLPDPRNQAVGERFGRAAGSYADHAGLQRDVAEELARRIAGLDLPPHPRILEIGCGTGFLSAALGRLLGPAHWTLTDIAPGMVETTRASVASGAIPLPGTVEYRVMDGEHPPADAGSFDLICSSMAMQWFADLDAGLTRLTGLLVPGGRLALATLAGGSFAEWRAAHAAHGLRAAVAGYPTPPEIGRALPGMAGTVDEQTRVEHYGDGLSFLKGLRSIGATAPTARARPLSTSHLRQVLHTFDAQGASITYHIAYGIWRKQ